MIGFVHAFLHAGARSVVASQWTVRDGSTALLMEHFYRRLRAGATKDEALRQAQIEMIRGGTEKDGAGFGAARPVAWSAFTLFGDWR